MHERQEELRERIAALGFDDVRFARVRAIEGEGLSQWLDAGQHADMEWMRRTAEQRLDPRRVLPGAQSIIMLGVNYWPGRKTNRGPIWARYAINEDYHDTMKPALVAAGKLIEEICGAAATDYRYYVDTGPVLERSWAAKAGVGFVGKNAMLISRRHGNWLFLAAIITRIEFAPDEPIRRKHSDATVGLLCGKCTRCLTACPTQAFSAPGVLDARRCISYQTIENKGIIPREFRTAIGTRIYGCDVCLEVCPWNRFAQEGRQMLITSRHDIAEVSLRELLELTPEKYAHVFRRTPIKRLKLPGLLRNACIVAGNSADKSLVPSLVKLAAHEKSMVRAHAVWALRKLGAESELEKLKPSESDPEVLAEFDGAVERAESGEAESNLTRSREGRGQDPTLGKRA